MRLFTLPGTRATVQCPAQPRPAASALVGALLLLLTLTSTSAWAQPTWATGHPGTTDLCQTTYRFTVIPPVGVDSLIWRVDIRSGHTSDRWRIDGGTDSAGFSVLRMSTANPTITVTVVDGASGAGADGFFSVRGKTTAGVLTPFLSQTFKLHDDAGTTPAAFTVPTSGAVCAGGTVGYTSANATTWIIASPRNGWSLTDSTGTTVALNVGPAGSSIELAAFNDGGGNVCDRVRTLTINVPALPATPTGLAGPATVCSGATGLSYTATGATHWLAAGTGWSPSTYTAGASLTATAGTAPGTIQAINITAGCTSAVATYPVTVNTTPVAPLAIAGSSFSQACGNLNVEYRAPNANFWAISGGTATIASGQGNDTIFVNVGTSTFTLQAFTITAGCTSSATSQVITVPTPATPGAISAVSGTLSRCSIEGTAQFTASGSNFWEVVGGTGASIASGQGNDTITVNLGTAPFTLRAYNIAAPCTSAFVSAAITVTLTPATPTGIAGPDTVCSGTPNVIYTATGATHWRATGGGWTPSAYTAGASLTATAGTGPTTIEAVSITGACTSAVATYAVFVNPTPAQPDPITGASITQCSGTPNRVYRAPNATNWEATNLSGAFTVNPSIVFAGDSVTVNVGLVSTTRTFDLRAYQVAAGCSSTARTVTITVNPIPATPTGLGGPTVVCAGATGLSYTATGATHWLAAGIGWSPSTYTAGASLTATAGTGPGTIQAINITAGCTSLVATRSVTVNPLANNPTTWVTNPATACSGQNITYQVQAVAGANDYAWLPPAGWTVVGGANGATITFTPSTNSGTVQVWARTAAGCSSAVSLSQAVTTTTTPGVPTGFTGAAFCVSGSNAQTYSVAAVAGDVFNWSIPPGTGTIVESGSDTYSALNDNSIQVVWNALPIGTNSTTRAITVSRTRNGCAGPSISPSVTINRVPDATVTGAASVSAQTFVPYSVPDQGGTPVTYAWSFPTACPNVTFASATNTNAVTVAFGVGATGVCTLRVTVTNAGCTPVVTNYPISITACPSFANTITVDDNSLCGGDRAVMTLNPSSYSSSLTVNWEVSTDGGFSYGLAPNSIQNSPVFITDPLGVGNYLYRARATQPSCSTLYSPAVAVAVSTPPTVGTLSVLLAEQCANRTNRLILPAGSTGGNPVIWEVNGSFTPVINPAQWYPATDSASGGVEIVPRELFRISPFAPGSPYINNNAHYRARVALACGEVVSNSVTVQVRELPSGAVSPFAAGFDTVCVGDPIALNASVTNATVMTGQWSSSLPPAAGTFSTVNPAFIANPAADPLATFTPNTLATGRFFSFTWTVSSAASCAQANYSTSVLYVNEPPQGNLSFPQNPVNTSPCYFSFTQPIQATASNGLGFFQVVSVPPTPLDPNTQLYNSQFFGFPYNQYFIVSNYTPTPSTGATVQLFIGQSDTNKVLRVVWVTDNAFCAPDLDFVTLNVSNNRLQASFPPLASPNACVGEAFGPLGATVGGGTTGRWIGIKRGAFDEVDGVFSNANSGNSTFTPAPSDTLGGGVTLYWEATNSTCGSQELAYYSQNLNVIPAAAGSLPDTSLIRICVGSQTPPQNAQTVHGTGIWRVLPLVGGGYVGAGSFTAPTSPTTRYTSVPADGNQEFAIAWTLANGTCTVQDTNRRRVRVDALSSGSFPVSTTIQICAGELSGPLGAQANNGSIGFWTIDSIPGIVRGLGGFSGALNDPNAQYFSVIRDTGKLVRARWTTTNGVCPSTFVTRDVFVRELSQGGVNVSATIEVCEGDTSPRLSAFVVHGVGRWEAPNPPVNGLNGTFFSPDSLDPLTDPRAQYIPGAGDVTGATGQATKTLRWTVQNANCTPSTYQRNITVFQTPSGGISGATTRSTCFGAAPVDFAASNGPGTTVQWFSSGAGTFSAPTSASTNYAPAQADTNTTVMIRFRVTSAGGCAVVEDTVFLNVFRVFADARRAVSLICRPTGAAVVDSSRLTVVGNFSPTSSYVWTVPPGIAPGDLSSQIVRSPLFKPSSSIALGTYVFTVRVIDPTRGGCEGTDTVSVTVTDGGSVVIQDPYNPMAPLIDQNRVCLGVPFTVRASPGPATPGPLTNIVAYNWSLVTGTANLVGPTNLDSLVAEVTGSGATFRVRAVTSPTGCEVIDDISITSYAVIQPNLQAASTCPEEPVKVVVAAGLSSATEQCQFLRWFRGNLGAQGGNFTATNPNFLKETPNALFQSGPGGVLQDTLSYERGGRDPMTGDLATGTYEFCVFCIYPAGCESQAQAEYAVVPQPQADFVGAPSVDTTTQSSSEVRVSFFNSSVYFRASRATPGTLPPVTSRTLDVFLWNFGDTASGDLNRAVTDTATHVYTRDGEFTVTLFVADNLGCSSVLPRPSFVKVDRPDFFFPQAFTPDQKLIASPPLGVSADINETFRPLPASIDSNKYEITRFEVFNSKGVLVFDTRSPLGWDGRLSNGQLAETGVYTYVVEVQFFGSAAAAVRRRYTGQVRLLR